MEGVDIHVQESIKQQNNSNESLEKIIVDAKKAIDETNFDIFKSALNFTKAHAPKLTKSVLPSLPAANRISEVWIQKNAKKTCQIAPMQTRARTVANSMPAPYMHLEASYCLLKPNVAYLYPFDAEYFIETIKKGLELVNSIPDGDKNMVFELFKRYEKTEYENFELRRLFKECKYNKLGVRSQMPTTTTELNNNEGDKSEHCSADCYKAGGIATNFPLWTVNEEFQVRTAMIKQENDYCAIAKEIQSKSCNEIYQVAQFFHHSRDDSGLRAERPSSAQVKWFYEKRNGKDCTYRDISFYHPCNHEGECNEMCPCYSGKNYCEKFCSCGRNCKNRFNGCLCDAKCDTKLCPCFVAHRECDKDLCKRHNNAACSCVNIDFTSRPKKLEVKMSPIKNIGFGLFTLENIEKGDFIIEYTGELISQDEADSRSKYYSQIKRTYVFMLCKEYSIDGFYVGNNSRFINHSDTPNCEVKLVTSNGEKRVFFFAKRKILANEELNFSYNFDKDHESLYL